MVKFRGGRGAPTTTLTFSDWYGSDVGMRVKDVFPPPLKVAEHLRRAEAVPNRTRGLRQRLQELAKKLVAERLEQQGDAPV